MPMLARRKSMRENPRQIFRRNPHAVVGNFNPHAAVSRPFDPNGHLLPGQPALIARIFRIAQDVHQDLQQLVLVHGQGIHRLVFPQHFYAMPRKGARVHRDAILHHLGRGNLLMHTGNAGVVLLHGHNFIDVLHILSQPVDFIQQIVLLVAQILRHFTQVSRKMTAFLVRRQKAPQIVRVFPYHLRGLFQVGRA